MEVFAPPLLTQDGGGGGGGGVSPSWVLLDQTAYISEDSVSNSTTAVGQMSTGKPIHISICLGRPPLLSYVCAHFPGPVVGPLVGTVFGPPAGTLAVRCVSVPPVVISTHADLALVRVTIPGLRNIHDDDEDYFVYRACPRPGASSLDLLPRPAAPRFRDSDVAIVRCSGGSRYVIAVLRTTSNRLQFNLQRYDSDTRCWTMTLLTLHQQERDRVLPIPDWSIDQIFHNTTKVVVLGSILFGSLYVGWVDLWRGILYCDVLDKDPVLRDMPLPKPSRSNRRSFGIGSPISQRDITVLKLAKEVKILYVDMEFRHGVVPSPQRQQPIDHTGYSSDDEDDIDVADYWTATVWSMPWPITSWNDWHKDCTIDVADTIVQNPGHCKVLLALPTRLSTDPEGDAAVSLRRLCTGYPTLGLGTDGNLALYFLSKVDLRSPEGWVIEVGVKDNMLHSIAKLDYRKNKSFRRYFCITDISKYLIRATGAAGALVQCRIRNKRRGMR